MKRLLSILLAVLLAGTIVVGASADEIDISGDFTDPAFLAKVYEITGIAPGDPIYPSDVEKIQDLNISRLGIESLNGLGHFKSLRIFYCNYNPLKGELDLTENKALEKVQIFVTNSELTSVIVSGLVELQTLDLSYNLLTELDCSNLPALQELYLTGNNLTSLDITNTPSLKKLNLLYNEFESKAGIKGYTVDELDALEVFAFDPQGKEQKPPEPPPPCTICEDDCPCCGGDCHCGDNCNCDMLPLEKDMKLFDLQWFKTNRRWAWLLLLLVPFLVMHQGMPFFVWFFAL